MLLFFLTHFYIEGKWEFTFDEEQIPGHLTLDISIQKHLSSSLIDVDVHPTYISVVIKSKVLRLVLPVEVKASISTAKRSTTTGHLLITMPKFNPNEKAFLISNDKTKKDKKYVMTSSSSLLHSGKHSSTNCGLQEELVQEAKQSLSGPVQYRNITNHHFSNEAKNKLDMVESSTRRTTKQQQQQQCVVDDDKHKNVEKIDDEPPSMF